VQSPRMPWHDPLLGVQRTTTSTYLLTISEMPLARSDANGDARCAIWPMPMADAEKAPPATADSRLPTRPAECCRVTCACARNHTQLFVREKSALQMYISEPRGWTDLHAPDAHGHYGGHGVPVIATIRYLQSVLCAQCWSRRLMHSTSMLRQDRGVPGCAVH